MKKIGLVLFLGAVGLTVITGNQCRKKIEPTPLDTTTTVVKPKDTSGMKLVITCKDGITSTANLIGGAEVYMVNNFEDWTQFDFNHITPPADHYRHAQADVAGECQFDTVRPASNTPWTGHVGGYAYYFKAVWGRSPGDTLVGYPYDGTSFNSNPIKVVINGTKQVTMVIQ